MVIRLFEANNLSKGFLRNPSSWKCSEWQLSYSNDSVQPSQLLFNEIALQNYCNRTVEMKSNCPVSLLMLKRFSLIALEGHSRLLGVLFFIPAS